MADIKSYSIKEAVNRIYRLFNGNTPTSDVPGSLSGIIYSKDEALSRLAELFAGSLPGESASLPTAITVAGSQVSDLAHEYGSIYTSTGTVTVSIPTSWTKVTGSFQNNGLSTSVITPNAANDRIVINEVGVYFVGAQFAFSGTNSAVYDLAVYLDGTRQEAVRTKRKLNANGDVGSASVMGHINVTGSAMEIELYALADGTRDFLLEAGQIVVQKMPVS